jgi:peroxiredoxin
MTLKQDIDAFVAQAATRMPADLLAEVQASIDDVKRSGIETRALKAGDFAPAFTLPNAHRAPVALADLVRHGPVILTFYRGVWCPYCNLELRAYQQILGEIRAAGGDLIAISPQTPDNSLASIGTNALAFEVLSDSGAEVAAAFGLAYPVPAAVRKTTAMFGVDIDQINGATGSRLPVSATYVIGTDRRIALASVDADFRVRLEPAEALAALRGLAATRPTLAAE